MFQMLMVILFQYHITHATHKLDISSTNNPDEDTDETHAHEEIKSLNNNNTQSSYQEKTNLTTKYVTNEDIEQEFITPTQVSQAHAAPQNREKTTRTYITLAEVELLGNQSQEAAQNKQKLPVVGQEQITPQHAATVQDKIDMAAETSKEDITPTADLVIEESIISSSATPVSESKPALKPRVSTWY